MATAEPCLVVPEPEVHVCHDPATGLEAVVAIDDPLRTPAVGGCRMCPYRSQTDAIADAVRLARAMSRKSALAGLPFGGAKSVIVGDPALDKSTERLRAFGRFVEGLGGRYVAAEDVGISVADIDEIGRETHHVAGRSRAAGSSGDPSPSTARGVLVGIRAGLAALRGDDDLAGVRVAVQGLGSVGYRLAELLARAGARLVVADLDQARVERAHRELGARVLEPDQILSADVDVLAPCALGGVLDLPAISRLRAALVAGAANNVLADERAGDRLAARGILYAPDYVINAGGILQIGAEILGRDPAWLDERIAAIGPRLAAIFRGADTTGIPPHRIADEYALRALGRC